MIDIIDLTHSMWGKEEFVGEVKDLKEFVIHLMVNCKDDSSFTVEEIGDRLWFISVLESCMYVDGKETDENEEKNDGNK